MLSNEENLELISLAQQGDEYAKAKLITEHSPLIKSVIHRFCLKGVEYEDLFQLGCIGFLKAIKNFSEEFGARFSTYAVPMIAGEVKRFLRDDGYIKVSRTTKTLAAKISCYVKSFRDSNCRSPSVEEIAKEFGLDVWETVFTIDSSKFPVSLYEQSDDERNTTVMDKVADKETCDDRIDKILLRQIIDSLGERDKKIVLLRFYRDKTQSEVAKELNVSQVQISRLETKILERFRSEFGVSSS